MLRYLNVNTEIVPNTTEPEDLKDVDALILSGGAPTTSIDGLDLGFCGKYLDVLDIPILGICAGAQFMAMHYGGTVGSSENPEFGKTLIYLDREDAIFEGVVDSFVAWESHNDEIKTLPDVLIPLAHSENCRYQAIKHREKMQYGLQFHPEVEHTEYGMEIFKNFISIVEKHSESR